MTNGSQETTKLVLTEHRSLGRVQVEMEAFFEFSFSLAEDLQDLVDKWAHRMTPKVASNHRCRKPRPR